MLALVSHSYVWLDKLFYVRGERRKLQDSSGG